MDQSLKTLELTTKLNSMELDSQIKVAANLIIAYRFQVAPGVYAFGTDRQIEYTTNKGITTHNTGPFSTTEMYGNSNVLLWTGSVGFNYLYSRYLRYFLFFRRFRNL